MKREAPDKASLGVCGYFTKLSYCSYLPIQGSRRDKRANSFSSPSSPHLLFLTKGLA
ncbi:hypothetical protein JYQ62_35085 [Nostoc sp. UHCC 0702]|nr:hypothetical protein JYQ62_35085 [Nostoc sp. UHCC 0702]